MPTFRASVSIPQGGTSFSYPTGTVVGDYALMECTGNSSAMTMPAGWTSLDGPTLVATGFYRRLIGRVVDSTSAVSKVSAWGGLLSTFNCGGSANPVEATGARSGGYTASGVTSAGAGRLLVWVASNNSGPGFTPPTGMTERDEQSPYFAHEVADQVVGAGATGTRTGSGPAASGLSTQLILLADPGAAAFAAFGIPL